MDSKKGSCAGLIFDIAFELVLCLAVLSAALFFSKNDSVGGPYVVGAGSLFVTFGIIAFYLLFMVRKSISDMSAAIIKLKTDKKEL